MKIDQQLPIPIIDFKQMAATGEKMIEQAGRGMNRYKRGSIGQWFHAGELCTGGIRWGVGTAVSSSEEAISGVGEVIQAVQERDWRKGIRSLWPVIQNSGKVLEGVNTAVLATSFLLFTPAGGIHATRKGFRLLQRGV